MAYKFQFGDAVMSGALEQEHGITVEAGGLTVTAGTSALQATTATTVSASTSLSGDSLTLGSYGIATAGVATIASMGGDWTNASRTIADLGTVTTATSITATDLIGTNIDGIIGAGTARAGTFAALAGTSLSVGDGNITNVGDINCDSVSVDDSAAGLDISFAGSSTGNNKLSLTDNLADALNITEAANSYIKFTTTDASELITFGQNSTFASTTIADLGTVSAATSITATDLVGTNIDGILGADTARAATVTTLSGSGTLQAVGATTLGSTLNVTGAATFASSVTAGTSFIIGSADLDEADMEKLDGITNGTVAASKAVIADSNLDFSGYRDISGSGTFQAVGNAFLGGTLSVSGNQTSAGNIIPDSDSARDLGSNGVRWANIYVDSITGATVALTVESRAGGQTISSATGFALVTAGDGAIVTLPAASAGKELTVKLSSSIGDVILTAGAGDLVEGAANIRLESTGSAVKLTAYDGQSWFVS